MATRLGRNELKGAQRLMFVCFILKWGLLPSKHTSIGFRVRGALIYDVG